MVAIAPTLSRLFRVGELVRFRMGAQDVIGRVVEDRGLIGVGGRQIVRLEVAGGSDEPEQFEMPAALLEAVPPPAKSR